MFISGINSLHNLLSNSIDNAQSIVLVTHKNPDGDGLAACLALKKILLDIFNKPSLILLDKPAPEFLNFLQADVLTTHEITVKKYDLIIGLDCHEQNRTNLNPDLFSLATQVIFIDHHEIVEPAINKNFLYYVEPEDVCTGIILHKLFYQQILCCSENAKKYYADCIYTTILNDTDNFLNSNVDKYTYEVCAQLMDFGLVPNQVILDFLLKKPMQYYQFIGNVLSTLEAYDSGQIVFFHSSMKMLEELNLDSDATSKMMRWTKGIENAKIQVYFQEADKNLYRISFRSDCYDVAALARSFNGGGHIKAAGCEISAELSELKQIILTAVRKLTK